VSFEVTAQPAGATAEFTAFTYELLCRDAGGEIFADGFETGDLSGWLGSVESSARL